MTNFSDAAIKKIAMRSGMGYLVTEQKEMLQEMMSAAMTTLINAGWPKKDFENDIDNPQAVEAMSRIVKRNLEVDSSNKGIDPMLIFDIGQNRNKRNTDDL